MAFDARHRIHSAVNFVLAHVIATMRKGSLGTVAEFVTRLDIFLIGVTVCTERFVMAGVTGLASGSSIKTVLAHKIRSAMIEGTPGIGVTFSTVWIPFFHDIFRVYSRQTGGVSTGIQQRHKQK
jgi:hypothetical protein